MARRLGAAALRNQPQRAAFYRAARRRRRSRRDRCREGARRRSQRPRRDRPAQWRRGGGRRGGRIARCPGKPNNARRRGAALPRGAPVDVHTDTVAANPGERPEQLFRRAASQIATDIESGWKKGPLPRYDQQGRLTAVLPISGLEDWVRVRERLAALRRSGTLTSLLCRCRRRRSSSIISAVSTSSRRASQRRSWISSGAIRRPPRKARRCGGSRAPARLRDSAASAGQSRNGSGDA